MFLAFFLKWDFKKKFVSNVLMQLELYDKAISPYNSPERAFKCFWDLMPENELQILARKLMAIIINDDVTDEELFSIFH